MKRILILFLVSILFSNCSSEDNDPNNEIPNENTNENTNELFAFKGDDEINSSIVPKIVGINQTNGNENTIASFSTNEFISELVFNNSTNEILGIGENNKLFKINVNNGTFSTINLDNSANIIYELIIDNQNNLYAFKGDDEINSTFEPKIVGINQSNGNENTIATFSTSEFISDFVFNNSTNEILGIGENNKLFKINVNNGTFSTINLDNTGNIFYELVIK